MKLAEQSYTDQVRRDLSAGRLLALAVITIQFGLIVVATRLTNLETVAFERVLTFAFAVFLIHHFMPANWRMGFFALVSLASVLLVLGPGVGLQVLAMGTLLILLCHTPIAFPLRVALVLAVGGAMALDRAHLLPVGSPMVQQAVWPVLGAMFMFRLMVYLYDLKHRTSPFGPARAASYFFMLPNVCFPLFPVVDYRVFQRSAYNQDALVLYQRGLDWMLRGLVQIALYKVIYFIGIIEPAQAQNGTDALRYVVATYLLYLKVSGTFHFIIGLLHMFGFGLPPTHRQFLFASSFTDLWRRMNIYWKEFIQKVVFNPMYFSIRAHGDTLGLVVATLAAFAATWFLHSYQWFWIRGSFPIVWSDLVFWLGLGVIVLVNVLWEAHRGRRRSLVSTEQSLGTHVLRALKIAGTFSSICILWAIWSTPELSDLAALGRALLQSGPEDLAWVVAVPLAVGILGVLLDRGQLPTHVRAASSFSLRAWSDWKRVSLVGAASTLLIAVAAQPAWLRPVSPELVELVVRIRDGRFNAGDLAKLQRGYYEDLGDVTRFSGDLWALYGMKPKGWEESPQSRITADSVGKEFIPSSSQVFKGAVRTINSLGLRDREYSLEPAPGVFRIALIGASHDMGAGVADSETYENLVEDRLNRELGPRVGVRFEILNFSHGGFDPVQKLAVFERRIAGFKPHLVLYVANTQEINWVFLSLGRLAQGGHLDEFPPLQEALRLAGLKSPPGGELQPGRKADSKLAPFAEQTLTGLLTQLRDSASSRGVRAALVLAEIPDDGPLRDPVFDRLGSVGRAAGLPVLDLQGVFADVGDRKSLWIAPWDSHTNSLGHRLVAQRLYKLLVQQGLVPTEPGPR